MILFTFTVILFFGIAGIFSNYYSDFTNEIFLGLSAPVSVGYIMLFFINKYSNIEIIHFNKVLVRGFAIKFIFYGIFILIIFTVYSFNPVPFMCSFTVSFVGLHLVEAMVLRKIQAK